MGFIIPTIKIFSEVACCRIAQRVSGDAFIDIVFAILDRAILTMLCDLHDGRPREQVHATFPGRHISYRSALKRSAFSAIFNFHTFSPCRAERVGYTLSACLN